MPHEGIRAAAGAVSYIVFPSSPETLTSCFPTGLNVISESVPTPFDAASLFSALAKLLSPILTLTLCSSVIKSLFN